MGRDGERVGGERWRGEMVGRDGEWGEMIEEMIESWRGRRGGSRGS